MRTPDGPKEDSVEAPDGNPGPAAAMDSPDRLHSWKEIAAYLGRSVLTAQRWEKNEGLPVRRHTHERQASVYANRSEIDRWWRERGVTSPADDATHAQESAGTFAERPTSWLAARRPAVLLSATLFLASIAVVVTWQVRASKVRWARQSALPTLEHLLESPPSSANRFLQYRLAADAERYIRGDAQLEGFLRRISRPIDVGTEPPEARFSVIDPGGSRPIDYGVTPLRGTSVPAGFLHWRLQKDGYQPVEGLLDYWRDSLHVILDRTDDVPAGMVRATGGTFELRMAHLGPHAPFHLTDYWIDQYEVTNHEFKRFVDAGGYSQPRYWTTTFKKDGRELTFSDAMRLFVDRTGRPGPATWDAGDFPQGKGDYPVTGVSWFEASAYAEFAGKSLPTVFHWARAAGVWANSEVVPLSNFSGDVLAPVGRYRGLSVVGTYDMAGNAKEWCLNASGSSRIILGGASNEPFYMFSEVDAQPPFSRAENFGFRLVKYITPPAPALMAVVDYPQRNFARETPVSDAVFKVIRRLYAYDKGPLNATTDVVDDSHQRWRKELVSFDAGYGGERMTAMLFLPRHARPPYQTVVSFPGSTVINERSSREWEPPWEGAIVASGRALVVPVYKGTFERHDGLDTDYPAQTNFYREHMIDWYRDLARAIDYVETRSDLDASRIAYLGFSWGARLGPLFLALEPRMKAAALVSGGLKFARTFPEADPFNFAGRVTVPVLMVNGKYDYFFPLETSQQPLFALLGTRPADKRHVVVESSGHVPPPSVIVKEVLAWLDRYLSPVSGAG